MVVKKKTSSSPRRVAMRLPGTIARDLGTRIVSGGYQPGDLLQNEIEASERLKVSRSAYREAVRILSAKGLVHSRPKVGTRISPPEQWHLLDPDVLSWIFELDPPPHLLADLFELRKMIEPQAAALAASRRTPGQLERMRRALDGMATHTLSTGAGRLADQEFHLALLEAAGNTFIASMSSSIAAAITWTTEFKQRNKAQRRDPLPDHIAVYEAISAADPQAAHETMYALVDLAFLDTKAVPRKRKRAR